MMRNAIRALRKAPKLPTSSVKKSSELGSRPVSHAVKVVTTAAKASAMIRPVAISIRLPLRTNALKPLMLDLLWWGPERAADGSMAVTLAAPRHREELRQRRAGDRDRLLGARPDH